MINLPLEIAISVDTEALRHIDMHHMAVIQAFVVSSASEDPYTYEHSLGVARFCAAVAEELGHDSEIIGLAAVSGLLHDVGKVMVPKDILLKNGRLSADEFEFIKRHPKFGDDILSPFPIDERVRIAAVMHHERLDGAGYPHGSSGTDIPMLARIVSVADIVDAMSADRPYRNGLPEAAVRQELLKLRHSALDPEIVDCAIALMAGRYRDPRWSAYTLV
jgi:putative nucleotidyltransferase with HDIG domain